ncbi:DNA translocase FtsK [Halocynthiibacter namhaensis]|uniref:DNA translocase FtsK n=1 Tax=Halocynthiibacter namhaensis TaxID=1290553 RepID=UPI0005797526|nr:DNA translocase FtsK [Halocynthiibacter namhaensis]
MASYQIRQRDPLFDSDTQASLEKRSKELLGVAMIIVGIAFVLMLSSFSPSDPSWFVASDAPVQNTLGTLGAKIAWSLYFSVGWGSWAVPMALLAWGGRYLLHYGEDRALMCLIFLPVGITIISIYASVSVYASSLANSSFWTQSFGPGGFLGAAVVSPFLSVMHNLGGVAVWVNLLSIASGIGMIAMMLFVLGFTRSELTRFGRFLIIGAVVGYAQVMRLLGKGAKKASATAQAVNDARLARQQNAQYDAEQAHLYAQTAAAVEPVAPLQSTAQVVRAEEYYQAPPADPVYYEDDSVIDDTPPPAQEEVKQGLLASLLRRTPEPELVQAEPPAFAEPQEDGSDRIKSRISDAIQARRRRVPVLKANTTRSAEQPHRAEPQLTRVAPAVAPMAPMLAAAMPVVPQDPAPIVADVPMQTPTPERMSAPIDEYRSYEEPEDFSDEPLDDYPAYTPFAAEESVQEQVDQVAEDIGQTYAEEAAYERTYEPAPDEMADPYFPEVADVAEPPVVQSRIHAAPIEIPQPPVARAVVQHAPSKPVQPSRQAKAEAQPNLQFDPKADVYENPPLSLLASPEAIERHHLSDEALEENARMLESVLDDYGVKGEIVSVRPGPVVTMYELEPAPGLKASRVIGLADDIARSMSALSARVSTVPGRSVIGIELPNEKREMVSFREILSGRDYGDGSHALPLALGKDIGGAPVVANLAKMPHLLIAGTTGSGKSVAINTMILSLLYKLSPDECRMIMIDPKMLELSVYDGIPHLLSPVVTDPKKAVVALKWVVGEMEERYRKMSRMGVRNIAGYNGRVEDALAKNEMFSRTVQTGFDEETGDPIFETEENTPEKMPYIVVVVDEMADLMMVAGKEIEACIQRLAQMARASGIHIIMATQRPSVDVITGTIKANFPTRISFQVTSKIDSRTILGEQGAEQLLGMGDMLYMAGGSKITRVHGPFCSDEEVEEIVNHLKAFGPPKYIGGVVDGLDDDKADNIDAVLGLGTGGNTDGEDAIYDQAVAIVIKDRKCSTSYIQRKLAIGYNKAARLVEQMEDSGLVSAANHVGKREILVPEQA